MVTAAPAEPRPSRRPRDSGGPGHGRENPEDDEVLLGAPGLLSRPQSSRRRCPAPSAASHGGHLTAPHGAGDTEIAGSVNSPGPAPLRQGGSAKASGTWFVCRFVFRSLWFFFFSFCFVQKFLQEGSISARLQSR